MRRQGEERSDRWRAVAFGCLLVIAVTTVVPAQARAHEIRPGYLELLQINANDWNVIWKVPVKNARRLDLRVELPEDCGGTDPLARRVGSAFVERWRASCRNSILGRTVSIAGLKKTRTDVLARVKQLDGTTQTVRLTPRQPSFAVARSPSQLQVAASYFSLGVEHILGGIDHLLFVLAMLLLVKGVGKLVGAITAFTIAHSLTLVAATLGWLNVPSAPVEAAIALSIVFVAAEVQRRNPDGLTARWPWLVTFSFGLLHGLGFAGALRDMGLPEHAIPVALGFFNVGVEAGQLTFIAAVLGTFKLASVARDYFLPARGTGIWDIAESLSHPTSYAIGSLGAFWMIDRTISFWA